MPLRIVHLSLADVMALTDSRQDSEYISYSELHAHIVLSGDSRLF